MTRIKESPRYRLTIAGKIVLAVTFVALFLLGAVIGNKIFAPEAPLPDPSGAAVGAADPSDEQQQDKTTQENGETVSGDNTPAAPVINVPGLAYDESKLSGLDTKAIGWGFGNNVDESNRPVGSINAQNSYGQYDADFIAPATKTVYLTIDEGYENGYTAQILDVLKEKDCPAVFFVTMSYVKSNPELIQRMLDEGHVIGNHSVTHPSQGLPSQSIAEQANEVIELHKYMRDNYGYEMYLFRFPAGIYSEQSLALVQQLGYRSVFWSYAYRDWETDNQPDPTESLQKLNSKMHDGAIYLLHAVSSTNAQIMGQFIDDTRAAGYTFASYPQEFKTE